MKSAVFAIILVLGSLISMAQGAGPLVRQLNTADSDSMKVVAFRNLANHYTYSNMDSALHFGRAGLAYARNANYVYGQAVTTQAIGQVLERHGFLPQAKEHYQDAKLLYQELGELRGVAATTNGLGIVAGRTGKYDEATRYFLEALTLYEEIGNQPGIVQTLIKLGVVNDHLGNLDKALEYYLEAESLNANLPSSNATLTLLNNIGIIYGKRDDFRTALKYFQRGIHQSNPETSTGAHIALLGSLGIVYEKLALIDSAWFYQQQALSLARQNDMPEEQARSLVNLAALVRSADPEQSLDLLTQALDIAHKIHHLMLTTEIYESMIGLYKEQHQYKLAMELTERRQLLKDSLFSVEKSREIANLQATQELARQENEIKHLALKNEKSVFQRNIMFAVATIAVAMIIIIWFYNARVSNLNAQLLRQQEQLKNSNEVKDKLFSVLGHDLRAPLNSVIGLLNLFSLQHENKEEAALIDKLKQQSQTTLETLDNLLMWGQNQLKGIRLDQQTLKAKDQIRKSIFVTDDYASQKNVRLIDNVQPDLYIFADPSHFDFVMRNLLSNAIKFSHAGGSVSINATRLSDYVVFSIADAGVGIPKELQEKIFTPGTESVKGTWNEKGTGIGLMLCQEYIAENGGKLWVDSKEGEGSTFYFSLKRKDQPKSETESLPEMAQTMSLLRRS